MLALGAQLVLSMIVQSALRHLCDLAQHKSKIDGVDVTKSDQLFCPFFSNLTDTVMSEGRRGVRMRVKERIQGVRGKGWDIGGCTMEGAGLVAVITKRGGRGGD